MIASKIGKTFLDAYNQEYGKEYSPKDFFEKVYWELFYNHPKYLQWVTNSPFVQMKKGQKPHTLNGVERKEKLENLFEKIESGLRDASIVIGYPASEEKGFATTSGSVTDISVEVSNDDVYYSWFGGSLGVGVAGGLSIFFDNSEILLAIFKGWQVYRNFLNDESIEKLAGNKINSWNGQWLNYYYSKYYKGKSDFSILTNEEFFKESSSEIAIETLKWSRLFFNLSRKLTNQTIIGYVYSLGQTNKTIGFIPFRFNQARYLKDVYKKLFGDFDSQEQLKDYENMMGINIKRACELGSIGIQALRPKDLEKYFKDSEKTLKFSESAKVKKNESDEDFIERKEKTKKKQYNELITFKAYKAWMVAMITKNKEEVLDYTGEVASKLVDFRSKDKGNSTKRSNVLKGLFSSKTKKMFLSNLIEVLEQEDSLEYLKELRDRVHLMNNEDFGYFVTLLKFDYAYQNKH